MNAMVNMIVRLERELEMQHEGIPVPVHNDFAMIKSKPKIKKTERRVVIQPVRKSALCPCPPCPASSD